MCWPLPSTDWPVVAPKKAFHTTIRIPQELADGLRAQAYLAHSTVNEEINHAIYDYLKARVPTDLDAAMTEAMEREKGFHLAALQKVREL